MRKKPARVHLSMDFLLWLEHFKNLLPENIIEIGECWAWAHRKTREPLLKYTPTLAYKGRGFRIPRLVLAAFTDPTILRKKIHNANACHTCDNHWCVNPKHLFKGTQTENMADMIKKGRRKGPAKHYP